MYLGLITVILATVDSLPTYHFSEFGHGASLNRAPRRLDTGFHNREPTIRKDAVDHDIKIFKRSDEDIAEQVDLANIKRSISRKPSRDNSHVDCFKPSKEFNSARVTADNELTTDSIVETTQTSQDNQATSSYVNNDNESPGNYTQEVDVKVSDSGGQTSRDELKGPVPDDVRNATGGAESAQGFRKPVSDTDEDRWIWGATEEAVTAPDINNRVAFDGGTCPTGKIKVAGKCVDVD